MLVFLSDISTMYTLFCDIIMNTFNGYGSLVNY